MQIKRYFACSFIRLVGISQYLRHSFIIMSRKHWLSVFLRLCTISALAVDLPLPLLSTSTDTNSTSLRAQQPECRADIYGDPKLYSCRQALSRMPVQPNPASMSLFSQRPPDRYAQKTSPWRTISRKLSSRDPAYFEIAQSDGSRWSLRHRC